MGRLPWLGGMAMMIYACARDIRRTSRGAQGMILNCVVRELQARQAEDLWKAAGITSRPGLSPIG